MDTILVVGVETVVGGNLAAMLAEEHRVVGLTASHGIQIENVEVRAFTSASPDSIRGKIADVAPTRIVLCGPAARSSWETSDITEIVAGIEPTECWATAAAESGCGLTLVSSDAVFTGPWMFHRENSTGQCPTVEAAAIRQMESRVLELCPGALVVRTNAYGWSPRGAGGWLETALMSLSRRTAASIDCVRHATPILATDLVSVIQDAWSRELQGVYHVGGSERVNPARFVACLAEAFELPTPLHCRIEPIETRPEGFGCGETSLHTKKIRKALEASLPTVADGVQRLRAQQQNGYAERICPTSQPAPSRAAG